MKITFVLPFAGLAGGIRVVAKIAEALVMQGHDVIAVSCHESRPKLIQQAKSLLKGKGLIQSPPPEPSHFDGLIVKHIVAPKSPPIAAQHIPDADWVIATWFETAAWVHSYPDRCGKKGFFLQQYEANFGFPEPYVDASWKLPLHKIVCAKWLSDLAVDRFGSKPLPVVNNGIDTQVFFPTSERKRSDTLTIGFLTAHAKNKGLAELRDVCRLVRQRLPETRILSYGTQPPNIDFEDLEFHERPDSQRLREIYNRCDVWLCTSKNEGFHLPPHEAMACGTPVVSTNVGGPMDMITNGQEGFLRAVDDIHGLADDIVNLFSCEASVWKSFSDASLAKARQYSWEHAADQFIVALNSFGNEPARAL